MKSSSSVARSNRPLAMLLALFAIAVLGIKFAPSMFVVHANGESGTRLLRMPSVSATQIAFAYAQNIWMTPRAGGMARRVTSFQGQTSNPHFSPDGKWIAFSGEYAGQPGRLCRIRRWRRAEASDLASGRRLGAGMDAGRQVDHVFIVARDLVAERRAAILDGAGRPAVSKSRWPCHAATRERFLLMDRTSPIA